MAQWLSVLTVLPKAPTFGTQHLYLIAYNSGTLCQPLDTSIYVMLFAQVLGEWRQKDAWGLLTANSPKFPASRE